MDLTTNKQKILKIHPEFILRFCKWGSDKKVEVLNPIPEDSTLIRIFQTGTYGELAMVIHSESFPSLKDGDEILEITRPEFLNVERKSEE